MGNFNGNGVFVRSYNWQNDAAANIKIRADRMDQEDNGFATGLSTCITKDGQTTITANLPMAGYRHINVGNAVADTDYAAWGQTKTLITTTSTASISGLTAETVIDAPTDYIAFYDTSVTSNRKALITDVFKSIMTLTADTTPEGTADYYLTYDASTTSPKKVLVNDSYKAVNSLTADATPDGTADFILSYDTSAAGPKKVLVNDIYKTVNSLTTDTNPDLAADFVLTYDTSASLPKKVLLGNISLSTATSVYSSGAQNISSGAPVTISFDSELYDDANWHDNVINNSRITVNFTGRVEIKGYVRMNANQNSNPGGVLLMNGSPIVQSFGVEGAMMVKEIPVVSGDYFELQAQQGSGGSIALTVGVNGSFLQARRTK